LPHCRPQVINPSLKGGAFQKSNVTSNNKEEAALPPLPKGRDFRAGNPMNLFRKALKSYLTSAGEMEVAALLTD
jgi:hypothetical protein